MKLTESQWQIMNCLWQRYPATARGIAERLPQENQWAYTTLRTLLARLVDKGAVREYKQGNTSMYEPVLMRDNARRSALKSLVNQAFDGALGPLMHFLVNDQQLSAAQREELAGVLNKLKHSNGGKKNDNSIE